MPATRLRVGAILLALGALVATPLAPADTAEGGTVGMNLGYVAVGAWDAWWYNHPGGTATLSLSWAASLFPGADYDLHLYRGDALDDGSLVPSERIAQSSTRTFAPHTESIVIGLPAGAYIVAVVPYQTQGEVYTLNSGAGTFSFAAIAPGFIAQCPPFPC